MKSLILLAFCVAAALAAPPQLPDYKSPVITLRDYWALNSGLGERIISGTPAAPGQFPFQGSNLFTVQGSTFICGCSLINPNWALSAAHCVIGASSFQLGFASNLLTNADGNRVTRITTNGTAHPGYNSNNLNNDVGLIVFTLAVPLGNLIGLARIPNPGETIGTGATVRVSGWGRTSDASQAVSQTLNFIDLTVISNAACAAVYGSSVVVPSTLCAAGTGSPPWVGSTCNGDSGGPLGITSGGVFTQHGVVSFVHVAGCGSGNPSGYVRTESMRSWIATHVPL